VRTRFLLPLAVAGAFASAVAIILLHRSDPGAARSSPPIEQPGSIALTSPAPTEPTGPATYVAMPSPPQAGQQPPEELTNHQAYVERRVAELQDLATENDGPSLTAILSELTNRDRDIRAAAIEAAVQFGSRDAIPGLTEAAAQLDDPVQRSEINKAIAFLELPSVSELPLARKR